MNKEKSLKVWGFGLLILILSGWIFFWAAQYDPAPLAGEVAGKLAANGAILYVMADQPESITQQNEFGRFLGEVTVVNCSEQVSVCQEENIEELPTIVFPNLGIELAGGQSMAELKKLMLELKIW